MEKIRNLDINPDWFYHQITPYSMKDILMSGKILSKRKRGQNKLSFDYSGWNGLDYISIAKYDDSVNVYASSYIRFIRSQYAFVLDGISADKTIYKEKNYNFWRRIAENPLCKKRYSCYEDEWQVKDYISTDKIIGIKIPEQDMFASHGMPVYCNEDLSINLFLDELALCNVELPFIDVDNKKLIEKDSIKQYILDRR